jgi:hypothetical protein
MKNLRVSTWTLVFILLIILMLLFPVSYTEKQKFFSPTLVPLNLNFPNTVTVTKVTGDAEAASKLLLYKYTNFASEIPSDNRYSSYNVEMREKKDVFLIGSNQNQREKSSNLGIITFHQEEEVEAYTVEISTGIRLPAFSWIIRRVIGNGNYY